jgi:hypothetical protein
MLSGKDQKYTSSVKEKEERKKEQEIVIVDDM